MEGPCQREHSSDKTWETMGVVLGEQDASCWKWVQAAWFQAEEGACAKVQGLTGAPKGAAYGMLRRWNVLDSTPRALKNV